MDCCNYVEAYPPGGHFYQQQQHYFCYDNANPAYAGYDAVPISNGIEHGARYNGNLPPAYPPDYVYNPKEARLRKAMREQNREQSRRSMLQSAIARAGGIGGPSVSVSVSGGFLDHHHRFGCVSTASSLPIGPTIDAERVAEPWFQTVHRPKQIHSPRIGDWYGNLSGDPIERLQAMGTMHPKSSKDVMRNQPGFPTAGYLADFGRDAMNRERELRRQDTTEYADFADGQKWHPYQNGSSPHPHPRTPHPSGQMAGVLQPNVQNTNAHGHGHGPWGQFCHGVLPHVQTMARNVGIRGPRHAVFLRDRLANRHCGFSEDTSRLAYTRNKFDVESMRSSYPPLEHQMPRLVESTAEPVMDSASTTRNPHCREEDDGARWEQSNVAGPMSLDVLIPTSTPLENSAPREKERDSRRSSERFEPKRKASSRQPLPGFHQAFGSTEIGRFSRSEFFVNMVGDGGTGVEVADGDTNVVSRDRMVQQAEQTSSMSSAAPSRSFESDETEQTSFQESHNELVLGPSIGAYCGPPRWHSPHVGAIGSEI
ncbi:hypothetical protein KM043_016287 [Ampulex compressa]|nr:hypothetical protein KM043_016287 [Ampulex compressa]